MRWPECVAAVRQRGAQPSAIVPHLASISFPVPDATQRDVLDVIRYVVCQSLVEHPQLCVDCAMFTTNVLYRQGVDVPKPVVSEICSVLLSFMQAYESNADVHFHSLRALAALLYDDGTACDTYAESLVGAHGILLRLAQHDNPNLHVQRLAVQCLGYMCNRPRPSRRGELANLPTATIQLVLNTLRSSPPSGDKYDLYKLYLACLKALQAGVQAVGRITEEDVPSLLASVKAYMLHDIDQTESQQTAIYRVSAPRSYDPLQRHMPAPPVPLPQGAVKEAPLQQRHRDHTLERSAGSEYTRSSRGGAPAPTSSSARRNKRRRRRKRAGGRAGGRGGGRQYSGLQPGASEESELSDASPSAAARGKRVFAYQIRIQALQCAQTIALACPRKILFRYWLSFFPETHDEAANSVYNVIGRDLIPKARTSALVLTQCLLQHCRSFLMTAEQSGRVHAFTSYAETLAASLHQLHLCLHRTCTTERITGVRHAAYKCMTALVESTPYHRFKTPDTPLLFDISTKALSSTSDPDTQLAGMKLLSAAIASTAIDAALEPELLPPGAAAAKRAAPSPRQRTSKQTPPPTTDASSTGTGSATATEVPTITAPPPPPLLSVLLSLAAGTTRHGQRPQRHNVQLPQRHNVQLQVGALQTLTALVCRQPKGLSRIWPYLSHLVLQLSSSDSTGGAGGGGGGGGDESVLEAGKAREEGHGGARQRRKTTKDDHHHDDKVREGGGVDAPAAVDEDNGVDNEREAPLLGMDASVVPRVLKLVEEAGRFLADSPRLHDSGLRFWEVFTDSVLQRCLESEVPFIRSCACDCLTSIGDGIFARLQMWKQRHYQALLLGLVHDDAPPVKAASARALGAMVAFPQLQRDAVFMTDMAAALTTTAADENITVRVRASWALGNYCNALGALRAQGQLVLQQIVDAAQLRDLLRLSLTLCEDKDKIRANALRAVGELARILPTDERVFFSDCVSAILSNTRKRPPKVQWNACHAAGNLLRNRQLKAITPEPVTQLLDTLLTTIQQHTNYKVRIGAASALQSVDVRDWANDDMFAYALKTLLQTLAPTGPARDFSEYRYRQTLNDEVVRTLSVLLAAATESALDHCTSVLQEHQQQLSDMMRTLRREEQIQGAHGGEQGEIGAVGTRRRGADRDDDDDEDASSQEDTRSATRPAAWAAVADVEALEQKLSRVVHITRPLSAEQQQRGRGADEGGETQKAKGETEEQGEGQEEQSRG